MVVEQRYGLWFGQLTIDEVQLVMSTAPGTDTSCVVKSPVTIDAMPPYASVAMPSYGPSVGSGS